METSMTDLVSSFAEVQLKLSDTLFRLWMQPLQLTQAAFAAGSDLIANASEAPPTVASTKHEVEEAAEEKIAHLDEEMDRAVPGPAAVVA
jgi:hypothetical protein